MHKNTSPSTRPILLNSTSIDQKLYLVEVIKVIFENITHNPDYKRRRSKKL